MLMPHTWKRPQSAKKNSLKSSLYTYNDGSKGQ